MNETKVRELLDIRFGGVIRSGKHEENGQCCLLELGSVLRGKSWSDSPSEVGLPDLRPINDSPCWESDEQRTKHMLPLLVAYWDWAEWTEKRRRQAVHRVAERMSREILPLILRSIGLNTEADRCEQEGSVAAARASAAATATATATATAAAATWAVCAAVYAARAAGDGGSIILIHSCRIWLECAEEDKQQ